MLKIGFIGGGNMGGAIAASAMKTGILSTFIYDKDENKAKTLADAIGAAVMSAEEIADACDIVFIATKPNIVPYVAEELRGKIRGTIVCMAAGVKISRLTELFGNIPIIRIMPNTPVAVGSGVVVYAKNSLVSEKAESDFLSAMSRSGIVEEIEEDKIDAVTALTGCGPAFVYAFAKGLAEGAALAGLSPEVAAKYAAGVIRGGAEMLLQKDDTPDELIRAVCSPGGSTIEGIKHLEAENFTKTVRDTVMTSYNKTVLLGKNS